MLRPMALLFCFLYCSAGAEFGNFPDEKEAVVKCFDNGFRRK